MEARPPEPERLTANRRAFTVLVRNAMWRRLELVARRRLADLQELDPGVDWEPMLVAYFDEHAWIATDGAARSPRMLQVEERPGEWALQQVVADPEEHHDWRITATLDLAASDERGEPALTVHGVVRL